MNEKILHRGEIVENVVRRSGYSLTKLASKLEVSRNTLYNKFKRADLSYRFIIELGGIIHYDFTHDFPELQQEDQFVKEDDISNLNKNTETENKHIELLERHIRLLELLLKVAHENELYPLKQRIIQLMEEESITR